jgi:hypothetical protein
MNFFTLLWLILAKIEIKSGRTVFFEKIKIIVFSEANFCKQGSYKKIQSHGLRFFNFSPFLLASAHFLFDARVRGLDTAAGAEKLSFDENFLAFQMQQRSIAKKLKNVVCEDCKHKIFFIYAKNISV